MAKQRGPKNSTLSWKEIRDIQQARIRRTENRRKEYDMLTKAADLHAYGTINETLVNLPGITEVEPLDFYHAIFRDHLEQKGEQVPGQYTGILLELESVPGGRDGKDLQYYKRYNVTRDLPELYSAIYADEEEDKRHTHSYFMAPISYAGRSAKADNARYLFALAVDLDDLLVDDDGKQHGLINLHYHMFTEMEIPRPSYIVSSGTGLHLYYILEQPIPLYYRNRQLIGTFRKTLIRRIWRDYITSSYKQSEIQYEPLTQLFRVAGTRTKSGDIARVFRVGNGDETTISKMLTFGAWDPDDIKKWNDGIKHKPKYTYDELHERWPDWTDRHFDKRTHRPKPRTRQQRKFWTCNRAVYDWFLQRLPEVQVGHRYYSMMCLAGYAQKCGISREEFIGDCRNLFEDFSAKDKEGNPWTHHDEACAIAIYDCKELRTLSVDAVSAYSGLPIQHNKRNGRTQSEHMKVITAIRDLDHPNGSWREGNGRKPQGDRVYEWRQQNPDCKNKSQCARELNLDRKTVRKWWDYVPDYADDGFIL